MRYPQLHRYPYFAIDTETTGLSILHDNVFGISVSLPDGKDFYWDIRTCPKCIDWLSDSMRNYKGTVIAYHASFDWHMLRRAGAYIDPLKMDCAMMRSALINEHHPTYTLDYIAKFYLGKGKSDEGLYEELADMFGGRPTKKAQMPNLHKAPSSLVRPYAVGDSRATLDLWEWQRGEIEAQDLGRVCRLERDLFEVVVDLEQRGVRVDIEQAEIVQEDLMIRIDAEQGKLNRMMGQEVNVNPSTSLRTTLVKGQDRDGNWRAIDGTRLNETATGMPQINADALRSIKHPAAEKVLAIRKMRKLKETFIEKHILGHQYEGRVHSHINQTKSDTGGGLLGTGTGRLSMSDPALQQIHKRDKEMAAIIRALFLPESNEHWASLDWSQADLRFFAHYTKSPRLVSALKEDPDADIHQITGDLMNIPRNPREDGGANAKQMGLAQVFGMGAGRLAQEMGLPYEERPSYYDDGRTILIPGPEAEDLFKRYHLAVTGVAEFSKEATRLARKRKWIMSIAGRKMHFPEGWNAHKAAGYLYQSGTAEAVKTKMVQTWRALRDGNMETSLLLSVHDELNFSTPADVTGINEIVKMRKIMQDFQSPDAPFHMRVPMRVDPGIGANWYEASCE